MSGVFDPTESRRLAWNLIGRLVNTPSPSLSLSLSSPPDLLHQINAPDRRRPLLCRTQTLRSLCFLFLFGFLGGFFPLFFAKSLPEFSSFWWTRSHWFILAAPCWKEWSRSSGGEVDVSRCCSSGLVFSFAQTSSVVLQAWRRSFFSAPPFFMKYFSIH